jgi:hypothetical protein
MPSPKTTRAKWTRDVAQVVEHLLCKHKTLNSNPSPNKKQASQWLMPVMKTFSK